MVVGAVALDDLAFGALPVFGMLAEPLAHLGGFPVQALDLAGVLLGQTRFDRQCVVGPVAGEHGLRGGFHLVGLTLEVGAGAAAALAGVTGQLDADQRPEGSPLGGWRTSRGR